MERDKGERDRLAICTDWSNHSTSWLMRHRLGLRPVLMDLMAGVEVTGNEAIIQALADFSKRIGSPKFHQIPRPVEAPAFMHGGKGQAILIAYQFSFKEAYE